jgi:hypothetical protein
MNNLAISRAVSQIKDRASAVPSTDAATFAENSLVILNKKNELSPLRFNSVQTALLNNLTGRDLVLKARQMGISTAVQAMLYHKATTGSASTLTVCADDDLTKWLRGMADRFWRHDPHQPDRKYSNSTMTTYPKYDSTASIVTVGGRSTANRKGRGSTNSHIHGSEVAFWPDAQSIIAGAIQAGSPQVILESTANGAQGYFYALCMEALGGDSPWTLHFYPWWSDTTNAIPASRDMVYTDEERDLATRHNLTRDQIAFRRAKQRELKHMFAQEYAETVQGAFLQSGLGYFGDIDHVFTAREDIGPDPTHRYAAGMDFGQSKDYTTCSIIDATTLQQKALLRVNRLPWNEMRRRALELCKYWNVSNLWAERNSMGSTNIEEMWAQQAEMGLNALAINMFDTTSESKAQIMSALHESFQHHDGVRLLPDEVQRHEFLAFQASQTTNGSWRLAAPEGEHDDTVIATALAYYACIFGSSGGIYIP